MPDSNLEHLSDSLTQLKTLDIKEMYIKLLMIKAKCFMERGDAYQSLKILQISKHTFSNSTSQNYKSKLKIYKLRGDIYCLIHQCDKAKNQYLKMLNLAW